MLDFSLTTELFDRYLLPQPSFQAFLTGRYRHLLVDNLEENVPVAQRLVSWLLPRCDSAVLLLDTLGGHRVFLGADALGAEQVAAQCQEQLRLTRRVAGSRGSLTFAQGVQRALRATVAVTTDEPAAGCDYTRRRHSARRQILDRHGARRGHAQRATGG